jgi:hypothetical protein
MLSHAQNNSELPQVSGSEYNTDEQSFSKTVLDFYRNFSGLKKLELNSFTETSAFIVVPDKVLQDLEVLSLWIRMTEFFCTKHSSAVYRISLSNKELNLIEVSI